MDWLSDHWLNIVGWGGSALLVFSLLQARVLRFRTLNTIGCLVLILFNAMLGVWPMVGMNIVLAAINVWFIVKLLGERHDEAAFEVLGVGLHDDYLRHVLRIHEDDIAALPARLRLGPRRGPRPRLHRDARRRDRRRGGAAPRR